MSFCRKPAKYWAMGGSPLWHGLISERHSTCVPSSHKLSTRACGNRPARPPPGRPKRALVGFGVRHVHHKTVPGHQPHPGVKCLRRLGPAQQRDDLLRQQSQGCHAHAVPDFAQRRTSRRTLLRNRCSHLEHLPIVVLTEQSQSDYEPYYKPTRQSPGQANGCPERRRRWLRVKRVRPSKCVPGTPSPLAPG